MSGTLEIQRTFGCCWVQGKMLLCLSFPGETTLNTIARRSLRPYQARLIADVCRSNGPVLVEQPTGSGKTMQIVTLVAMQLGRRFTHAVIAAPQQQIEHAFVRPDYQLVAFPGCGEPPRRTLKCRKG
jgi:ERCC4-related helicase